MWGFLPGVQEELKKEYNASPKCANDRELRLVRHNLKLEPGERRRLYRDGSLFGFGIEGARTKPAMRMTKTSI